MLGLILSALHLYSIAILLTVVLSWVGAGQRNPLVRVLREITEPLLRRIRRLMPFVVTGGLDFSPIVAVFLVELAGRIAVRILG